MFINKRQCRTCKKYDKEHVKRFDVVCDKTCSLFKQWNKEQIKSLLDENEMAVKVAIVRIYDRQTDEEKHQKQTIEENGVGFSSCDSFYLSQLALKAKAGKRFTDAEMAIGRNKIKKYAGQLADIANRKCAKNVCS